MKPIATVPHALRSVDVATGEASEAHHQRSDVCAVPAPGVVAEAMVALVLANACSRSSAATRRRDQRNLDAYLASIPTRSAPRRARPGGMSRPVRCSSGRWVPARPGRQAGRALLEVRFVDTDKVIVAEHGPIADLFARYGEPYFRRARARRGRRRR
jgi:hypothetical protein